MIPENQMTKNVELAFLTYLYENKLTVDQFRGFQLELAKDDGVGYIAVLQSFLAKLGFDYVDVYIPRGNKYTARVDMPMVEGDLIREFYLMRLPLSGDERDLQEFCRDIARMIRNTGHRMAA